MNNLINIFSQDGNLVVSSREVAKNFRKEHKEVIYTIEGRMDSEGNIKNHGLIEQISEGGKSHVEKYFIESSYTSRGKTYKEYLLTRDGFTLLAMGFTGKKALEWKLKYIEAFNKMENALKEVYHISETAIVNNVMNVLEDKLVTRIDERLSKYEENYRPTHANKISLNNYIKSGLGDFRDAEEVKLVKQRVLLMLDAQAWQDIPYEKLIKNMHLIDESIRAVKSFRTKEQLSLFDN